MPLPGELPVQQGNARPLLGEILVKKGIVNQATIDEAIKVQIGSNRRLGKILVRMKALTEDELVDALAAQLGIIPLNKTTLPTNISAEVKNKLPRYLCQKYDVIPLRLKNNNILEVAMSDPSDNQAISDLEQYTGNVIKCLLAKQSDIADRTKLIPYSLKNDFFSPQGNRFTRIAVAVCLILVAVVGGFSYHYYYNSKYGTVSTTANSTIYKNHDLMLDFDAKGTINILGRGAFAKGIYSASFKDTNVLNAFLASRKADLSEKQQEWLAWVIKETSAQGLPYSTKGLP